MTPKLTETKWDAALLKRAASRCSALFGRAIRVEGEEIRRANELPTGASEETDRVLIRRLDG
jgi:hypothetical protein